MKRLSTILFSLLLLANAGAQNLNRFPKPDFESGYQYPDAHYTLPNEQLWLIIDFILLVALMSFVAWAVIKKQTRKPIIWTSVISVAYFGFFPCRMCLQHRIYTKCGLGIRRFFLCYTYIGIPVLYSSNFICISVRTSFLCRSMSFRGFTGIGEYQKLQVIQNGNYYTWRHSMVISHICCTIRCNQNQFYYLQI